MRKIRRDKIPAKMPAKAGGLYQKTIARRAEISVTGSARVGCGPRLDDGPGTPNEPRSGPSFWRIEIEKSLINPGTELR